MLHRRALPPAKLGVTNLQLFVGHYTSVVSYKYVCIRGTGFGTRARRGRRAYPYGSVRSGQQSLAAQKITQDRHGQLPVYE